MKRKYKMVAKSGYPIETAIDKNPIPGLAKHLGIPGNLTQDVLGFTAKYVESFENLNRAYFGNQELAAAYDTIPFKALDLEHEIEKVIGHIHSHAYIDRMENRIVTPDEIKGMSEGKYADKPMDVLVGAIAYIDRFPNLEGPLSRKAYCLSMEVWFDRWDLRLENGVTMSLEEAEAMGLGLFIEQLMGAFDTKEEFDNAHSLLVTLASKKQEQMKVYKYLRNLLFSGAGAVISPACPSCQILSTSCDEEELKMAASCDCSEETSSETSKVQIYSLDLRKVDSYMKKSRDAKEIPATNIQVPEKIEASENADATQNVEVATQPDGAPEVQMHVEQTVPWTPEDTIRPAPPTLMPPPSTVQHTPVDIQNHSAVCLNYHFGEANSCLFADVQCEVAGDRKDKRCKRWFQDERGIWKYDSRNHIKEGTEEIVVNENMEEVVMIDEASTKKEREKINLKLEKMESHLEVFRLEREMQNVHAAKETAATESAATWTTKFINGLPDSSFAVVEPCAKDNKNARHLPFKDGSGKVDVPHLRNALARANQITAACPNGDSAALRAKAQRKLAPYAKRFLKTDKKEAK